MESRFIKRELAIKRCTAFLDNINVNMQIRYTLQLEYSLEISSSKNSIDTITVKIFNSCDLENPYKIFKSDIKNIEKMLEKIKTEVLLK